LSRAAGTATINQPLSLLRLNGINHVLLSENLDRRQ
jgi:hypothetical protein